MPGERFTPGKRSAPPTRGGESNITSGVETLNAQATPRRVRAIGLFALEVKSFKMLLLESLHLRHGETSGAPEGDKAVPEEGQFVDIPKNVVDDIENDRFEIVDSSVSSGYELLEALDAIRRAG